MVGKQFEALPGTPTLPPTSTRWRWGLMDGIWVLFVVLAAVGVILVGLTRLAAMLVVRYQRLDAGTIRGDVACDRLRISHRAANSVRA